MTRYKLYKRKIRRHPRYKTLKFKINVNRYFYVYRITDKHTNIHYYGSRISKIDPKLDIVKYGSSSKLKRVILTNKEN